MEPRGGDGRRVLADELREGSIVLTTGGAMLEGAIELPLMFGLVAQKPA